MNTWTQLIDTVQVSSAITSAGGDMLATMKPLIVPIIIVVLGIAVLKAGFSWVKKHSKSAIR